MVLSNNSYIIPPISAQNPNFNSIILVTKDNINNTGESATPRLAVDLFGNIHVVWIDFSDIDNSGPDADIFYKKFNSITKSWDPRILITDDNINNTGESWHPCIATDPLGNIHIVWDDSSNLNDSGLDRDIFYKHWDKETDTWGPRILITDDNSNNTGDSNYPCVTSDLQGNVHVVWDDDSDLNNSGTDSDIFYKEWDFVTKSWGSRILITDDNMNNTKNSYYPKLKTDSNGFIHIVWEDDSELDGSGNDSDIFYKKRESTMKSWSKRILITDDNINNTNKSHWPIISIDGNDNIHIAWTDFSDLDGSGSDEDVYYRKWDHNSFSWFSRILITNDNVNNTGNSRCWGISTDNYGNPYIVWYDDSDLDNSGTDFDIYLKKWDNETSGWGPRILITNDNINNTEGSRHPSITISSFNTLHIVWDESSNLLGSGSDIDIYYIRSNFLPSMPIPISPPNGFTLIVNTSMMKVTTVIDQDNDTIYYNFTISDQPDAESGTVYFSGWITSPSWKPPPLSDGKWYWHTYTYDGFNITSPDWVWNFTVDTSQSYGIWLYQGWNLISIPFIQMDTDLKSVLDSINGSYDAVQWFNASDGSDPWKHNHVSKPSQLSDLGSIDHTMGFWIHVTQSGGVLLHCMGILPTVNQGIALEPGWNLVGYPSLSNKTRATALNNIVIGIDVDSVWTFNASIQQWQEIGPSDYFEFGRGYWMHSKVAKTWDVPL